LNEAHGRDPRFFEFLRTLEAYRSILDERSTVVLSASSPLFRLLLHGPDSANANGPAANQARDDTGSGGTVPLTKAARQP
jgi:hypothetical protein